MRKKKQIGLGTNFPLLLTFDLLEHHKTAPCYEN